MLKSYKYRLYPTDAQKTLIDKHIGACRFIYNLALECKNTAYATNKTKLSCFDLMGQLPDLKKECGWLKEIDSQALQQSIIDMDKAFTSFFKGQNKFPNFKKKKGNQKFRNPHGKYVSIKDGKLIQPKFKEGVKIIIDREFVDEIKSTTISKSATGKYFVSILVDNKKELPNKKPIKDKTAVGIDLGLSHFIITSDGVKIDSPKFLRKAQSKLKYLQRQTSKKKKGSANKKKAYFKVALQHEKITNQRKDFLHKLSNEITNQYDTLCFETLNIKGMVRNHKLALSINDASWGDFVTFCKYKSEWKGKNVLELPTFEPSTKLCSDCGAINHTLTLKDREWTCANCGSFHDRDINAGKNIKNYCLTKKRGGVHRVKSVELPTLVGAVKQKKTAFK